MCLENLLRGKPRHIAHIQLATILNTGTLKRSTPATFVIKSKVQEQSTKNEWHNQEWIADNLYCRSVYCQ